MQKTSPARGELGARLARHGIEPRVHVYQYYWLATYRIMADRSQGAQE